MTRNNLSISDIKKKYDCDIKTKSNQLQEEMIILYDESACLPASWSVRRDSPQWVCGPSAQEGHICPVEATKNLIPNKTKCTNIVHAPQSKLSIGA